VQLDRIPPRSAPTPESGTSDPPAGVQEVDGSTGNGTVQAEVWIRRPVSLRAWALLAWLTFAVLGQGERFHLDHRFRTFDATLTTYWEALRSNDAGGAWECLADGTTGMPYPGMLWFLPPSDDLSLGNLRPLPIERGRMVVSYEVRYRPRGSDRELSFRTSSELVQKHGEWRIAHPIDAASVPEWRPLPVPVGC